MTVTGFFFFTLSFSEGYKNQEILSARLSTINTHMKVCFIYTEGGKKRRKSTKARKFKNKDSELYLGQPPASGERSVPASALALKELKERAFLSTWNFLVFVIVSFPLLIWVTTLY